MPEIKNVEQVVREVESIYGPNETIPGFVMAYEYGGISKSGVRGRVVGRLGSKFPLKTNNIKVENITKIDDSGAVNTYRLRIFIPFESFTGNATEQLKDFL